MKSDNWSLLVNPFVKIAGWKAFFVGIIIVIATVLIGYLNHICFPGLLSVKYSSELTLANAFIGQAVGLFSTVLVMYLAALIFAKGVRFQDILGTTTLSRAPFLLLAALGFIAGNFSDQDLINELINRTFNLSNYSGLLVFGLLCLVFSIWVIALLYNAFRISTDIKGTKLIIIFIGIVILSEILSMSILLFLL